MDAAEIVARVGQEHHRMRDDPVENLDSDQSEIERGRDREGGAEVVQQMSVSGDVIAMMMMVIMLVTTRVARLIHPHKIVWTPAVTLSRVPLRV